MTGRGTGRIMYIISIQVALSDIRYFFLILGADRELRLCHSLLWWIHGIYGSYGGLPCCWGTLNKIISEHNSFETYISIHTEGLNLISSCCILAGWPSELDLRDRRFPNKKVQCKSYEQRWRIRKWADCAFRDSRHNW